MKGLNHGGLIAVCLLVCFMFSNASAAEEDFPSAPEWCPAQEYARAEKSDVYTGAPWDAILALRAEALAGSTRGVDEAAAEEILPDVDAGLAFELGLISFKAQLNAIDAGTTPPIADAARWFRSAAEQSPHGEFQRLAWLWYARCGLLSEDQDGVAFQEGMCGLADYPDFAAREAVVPEEIAPYVRPELMPLLTAPVIELDGACLVLSRDSWPELVEGRTMLPIRTLAESIGAEVRWDQESQSVTLVRALRSMTFQIGSSVTHWGGRPLELEAAPYVREGRTFLPARCFLEQMEQTVEWAQGPMVVRITENKSLAGDSNLEAWALGLAPFEWLAPLPDPLVFGGAPRTAEWAEESRAILRSLGVGDRSEWLDENSAIAARCLVVGPDQIADMANRTGVLVQLGYSAGYCTYREALYGAWPVALVMRETFQSWDEVTAAICDYPPSMWEYREKKLAQCRALREAMPQLFDEALFQSPVVQVAGLDAWDEDAKLDERSALRLHSWEEIPTLTGVMGQRKAVEIHRWPANSSDVVLFLYDMTPGQMAEDVTAYAKYLQENESFTLTERFSEAGQEFYVMKRPSAFIDYMLTVRLTYPIDGRLGIMYAWDTADSDW